MANILQELLDCVSLCQQRCWNTGSIIQISTRLFVGKYMISIYSMSLPYKIYINKYYCFYCYPTRLKNNKRDMFNELFNMWNRYQFCACALLAKFEVNIHILPRANSLFCILSPKRGYPTAPYFFTFLRISHGFKYISRHQLLLLCIYLCASISNSRLLLYNIKYKG